MVCLYKALCVVVESWCSRGNASIGLLQYEMLVHQSQEPTLDPGNIESKLEEQFSVHCGKEIKQLENWPYMVNI